ncbi:MAG: hypothetical protein ABIQ31_11550 [Ferruginibacter sp.]
MKHFILFLLICTFGSARAQKIDSIYINLYTDSLKKGTQNYINIDGKLSNGSYLPLDSTNLIFSASAGKFSGNCLWIDENFKEEKVNVKVILKNDRSIFKEFDMYIKKKPNDERLKTADEIINGGRDNKKQRRKDN